MIEERGKKLRVTLGRSEKKNNHVDGPKSGEREEVPLETSEGGQGAMEKGP